ncbi:MAG: ABC transporter ATP-binding protein [Deltaproteobacteria bacterium]|jgi:branched-chain amino acid transport system ATP-binding protein|nr:ABC transporter ATP-binding protein [Deltaproteobacteria bacterium]MBT4643124.1 ABC transporter ATP-binding protein [Deltaproteobacteria bacterium]MBT6613526.1 ABC transporter ATP-binding protein [Deltaproteobacteria bacterium]
MAVQANSAKKPVVTSLQNLTLSFGGVAVLDDVSIDIFDEELLALIGPNGAGKTSLINCISGFYHPQKGNVFFQGQNISHLKPVQRFKLGISRTFQNIELYDGLTVLDNLMSARHNMMSYGVISAGLWFGKARREEIEHREAIEDIIDLLELESIRKSVVGSLPYGLRKRVDLGRALASRPKFLLLDEPMAGMNSEEKEDMARFILDIKELWKTTMVIIEHDMGVVMDISDRIAVLDFGLMIAEGVPEVIKDDPNVIRAYLGLEEQEAK